MTISNAPAEIVNKVYTHSLKALLDTLKLTFFSYIKKHVQLLTAIFVLEISRKMSLLSAFLVY